MPKLFEITDAYTPEETIDGLPVEPVLPTERPRVIINTAEFDKPKEPTLWDNVGMAGVENKDTALSNLKSKASSTASGIADAIKYASELDQKFTSSVLNFPKKAYENSDDLVKGLKNLFGLGEGERYQLWPEKVAREALTSAGDIAKPNPYPEGSEQYYEYEGKRQEGMVPAAMAISALAGSGGLGGTGAKAGEVALGATPFLRPALKHKEKLYKGKPGQEHQDIIPKELYEDFSRKAMSGEDLAEYNFGFINDKGHFLDREKALKYGIDTGLIDPHSGKFGALTTTLMADSSKPGVAIEAIKNASPFYSAVEHTVKNIPQGKMTGDQWLGTLSNKPGVKPEELDWTGLKSFLEENKGKPVTKQQIEEHLAANKVELKEVSKGFTTSDKQRLTELDNKLKQNGKLEGNEITEYNNLIDMESRPNTGPNATKYHSYQLPGGPLSRDTEILTDKGWKRIDAVEVGDVVMTRKDEAGILEWQPVQAIPKVYAEELYHFFSQSINMRVTENHQMIAKKRRRNNEGLQRLTAKELWNKSEMLVPLTGVWEGGETENIFGFDPHDLAELFGWYLAEGSYKHKNGNKHTIQIAQCKEYNPEKCARLEALLDRMGLPWRYYGQAYGIGIKTINKDLVELFHEQPTSEFKFVPYFFFNQSKSIIQSLLDGLILGDGCIHINEGRLDRTVFYTKSEQLAGDVQILILLIGKNANVRQRPSGLYCVGIKSKEWSSVDDAKFEIAPYNDFAFCVTVENHAIYVRRNGVAAFTGNSNYREMLLTLPDKLANDIDGSLTSIKMFGKPMNELTQPQRAEVVKFMNTESPKYKSSHWDEPNILAHVRMNDRNIDGKKSLHLEEIQSDWHQQGRDKGYGSKKDLPKFENLNNQLKQARQDLESIMYDIRKEKGLNSAEDSLRQVSDRELRARMVEERANAYNASDKYKDKLAEVKRLEQETHDANPVGKIPDAPFKKSWHELALKRMIREAAEKGYDRLSWTPGEAQSARYDLSKQLKELQYLKNEDGTYSIAGVTKDGGGFNHPEKVSASKLPDIVGKEMAEKIIKNEGKRARGHPANGGYFEGVDLKVGGEGMKGFYDQIIPKSVNKIAKEYGVKVEKGKTSEGHDIFYIDLPEGLKNTALRKGFPLFSNVHPGYSFIPYAGNPFENEK